MFNNAAINRKVIESIGLKLIFFLPLTVTCGPLAVHVGSAAQSPDCVEQRVCHCFTRWEGNTKNRQKRTAFTIIIQIPSSKKSLSLLSKTNQSFRNGDAEVRFIFSLSNTSQSRQKADLSIVLC